VRSAAQTPISRKRIFRVLPIFRTHFSHVISQITFRTFAFRRLPLPVYNLNPNPNPTADPN